MTEPQRDHIDGLQVDQETDTILKTLQGIASHDSVSGVAIGCLQLLQHDEEEIRSWAAECLSSSVQPDANEKTGLIEFLRRTTDVPSSVDSSPTPQTLADQMYWATTLVGRLALGDDEKPLIRELLNQVTKESSRRSAEGADCFTNVAKKADRLSQGMT